MFSTIYIYIGHTVPDFFFGFTFCCYYHMFSFSYIQWVVYIYKKFVSVKTTILKHFAKNDPQNYLMICYPSSCYSAQKLILCHVLTVAEGLVKYILELPFRT